jgi:DNA-binding IclR family transcriptional regulator
MSSPAADRTIRILEFFVGHPGQQFNLPELSRRVGISKTTANSILATLVGYGYLTRDESTYRYGLGPALIPLGSVAERGYAGVRFARAEAETLAERLQMECLVAWATQDEIVILSLVGRPRRRSITTQPGQRMPLVPPLGTVFMAWADQREVAAWLGRMGREPAPGELVMYQEALATIHERGYAVGLRTDASTRLAELQGEQGLEIHSDEAKRHLQEGLAALVEEGYLRPTIEDDKRVQVTSIAAPVFGSRGEVAFSLMLAPNDWLTGIEIRQMADHLLRATDNVMDMTNAQRPVGLPVFASIDA